MTEEQIGRCGMKSQLDVIKSLRKTNEKLLNQISALNSKIDKMKRHINHTEEQEKKLWRSIEPTKKALESMTAERSTWMKKLRRAGVKI
jgi:chromosome segregation ATPase